MLEKALINSTVDSAIQELKIHGRINDADVKQFQKAFSSQNLVIGIVGKMKAGKSSLVNAAVFGDNILPSGSQPITVTLTEVTYASQESVEVDLLTPEDILDLKTKAAYDGNELSLKEKAKNAQDTLDSFPANYEKLIAGKQTLNVNLSELEEFVSSTGQYSGLAKQVKIKIDNENLKGITIIDTPGFNDPVSSRGETTCNCLSRCNVILFVHNEDGYDQIDEELLKNQIEYAGISDMIDVFNKVDLLHMPFSEWDDQKEYFTEKRGEYVEKIPNTSNVYEVITKAESVLTSSLMALCGLIKSEKRTDWIKKSRSAYEEEYEEFCDTQEDKTLDDLFIQYSNINAVIAEINRIGRNSASYLLEAPLKTLKGKMDSIIEIIKSEIAECEAKIASYDASYKSAKQEIEEIECYLKSVTEQIKIYPLELKLQSHINQTFADLCSERSKRAISEFTKENYPEPAVLGRGVKKQNVARYNLFISYFEDIIRDKLGSSGENGTYGLIGMFKNEINEYVGSITEMLVSSKISEENRKLFKQGLLNELLGKLSALNVIISSHTIEVSPKGEQLHWSLFKTKFENTFDDIYLDSFMAQFRQEADHKDGLSNPSISNYKIQKLCDNLVETLSLTPEQKELAIRAEQEKMSKLNDEINVYKDLVRQIVSLMKS